MPPGLVIGEQKANRAPGRMLLGSHRVVEKSLHPIVLDEPALVVRAIERVVEFLQKLVTHSLGRTVAHAGPQQRPRISQTL